MPDTILYDSAMRLFAELVTPEVSAMAEESGWPEPLWRAVEEAGYPHALADGAGGMVQAVTILRAAGHHAAPIPLAETMIARWLCAACGVEAPEGALTIAPVEPEDRLDIAGAAVTGHAGYVPWGLAAAAIVLLAGNRLLVVERAGAECTPGKNLAGEPRDHLVAIALAGRPAPMPDTIDVGSVLRYGALLRAAQMAGAMEAVLGLSTRYADDRVQFGRPIARFQAIQQQLALLAEQAAAASVAVESAAIAVAADRPSSALAVAAAKIRAGEAAGKVAEIAHQVHGAIGFTHEHSLHRLTRRLWSWRDEFGTEAYWSEILGEEVMAAGIDALWPTVSAG
jgi:hypothetical protein